MRYSFVYGVTVLFILWMHPAAGATATGVAAEGSVNIHIGLVPPVLAAPDGDSLEYAGFSRALEKIFSAEKIASILSKLPPNCKIYGFDIGDFSGDDGMDVVLSTREAESRNRLLQVHFFLNDGAEFTAIQTLERRFVIEPIEVGFSIEHGRAPVTEKTGTYGWRITGYAVRDGIFRRVYEWSTDRMLYKRQETAVAVEEARDYETQLVDTHVYGSSSNRSFLRLRAYSLPLLPIDSAPPAGVATSIGDSTGLMIVRGGSSWHGPDDCSLFVSGRYDSSQVELLVTVHDDRLLYNTKADSSDYLGLYFDLSRQARVRPGGSPQQYSPNTQFALIVMMGDGEARGPVVELRGAEISGHFGDRVQVHVQRSAEAFQQYQFRISLPLAMFSADGALPTAGFTAVYHDVDYPANLHWVSLAATSRGYRERHPESYGSLIFVDDVRSWQEWDNLRTRSLSTRLRDAGVLP